MWLRHDVPHDSGSGTLRLSDFAGLRLMINSSAEDAMSDHDDKLLDPAVRIAREIP
jgi:hypothetical protein